MTALAVAAKAVKRFVIPVLVSFQIFQNSFERFCTFMVMKFKSSTWVAIFLLVIEWQAAFCQSHSVEIAYGIGSFFLGDYKNGTKQAMNSANVYYKYIGKHSLGFSTGAELNYFWCFNMQSQTALPVAPQGTTFAALKYSYLSLPLLFEGVAGKRKVHFTYHAGSCVNFAVNYNFSAYVLNNSSIEVENFGYSYNKFQPLQVGFLIAGFGFQAAITERFYIRCMIENRLYSFLPPYNKVLEGDGMFDSLILKVAIGINCMKTKERHVVYRDVPAD
jgi:hypothetical protein